MKKKLLLFSFQSLLFFANAQFTTPTIDGSIGVNEYGTHTNGQNQSTNGSVVWYMTWDNTNLYIAISGANVTEGAVVYLNKDTRTNSPIQRVGTPTEGTLVGQAYDGVSYAQLQFSADIVLYFKDGYREFRTADGSNGWSTATTGFGSYASSGSVREVSIPWTSINASGRPDEFHWMGFVTSSGGFVYGELPEANSSGNIGLNVRDEYYFTVNGTTDGSAVKPFARTSQVFNGTADASIGTAVNVYDFDMNATGLTLTRTGGVWNITNDIYIHNGSTINFGNAVNANVTLGGRYRNFGTTNFGNNSFSMQDLITGGTRNGHPDANFTITGTSVNIGFSAPNNTINSLTYHAANSFNDLYISGELKIKSSVTNTQGTINIDNNASIVLLSTSSGTAVINNITSGASTPFVYIGNGTITTEKYIPGGGNSNDVPSKRAYRFIAHPFSASINLSQITGTGEIDITGSGGVTNGFTETGNNLPSAYKYTTAAATANDAAGIANGWAAFSSANGGVGNTWDRYKGVRIFYRGAKNEGLAGTGSNYAVGNATITMSGQINTGNQTINLDYNSGASTGWNLVGNPYCSNVQMSNISGGRLVNTGTAFYVWNLALGTRGGYSTINFGDTYVLPAYSSFFTQATNTGASIQFQESDKTSANPSHTLFNNDVKIPELLLQLKGKTDNLWDEWKLKFVYNNNAITKINAPKLLNPGINLFSSNSGEQLAIEAVSVKNKNTIPLTITNASEGSYKFAWANIPDEYSNKIFLLDKKIQHTEMIKPNTAYSFEVANNENLQNRFELIIENKQTGIAIAEEENMWLMDVFPTVVNKIATVKLSTKSASTLSVVNIIGKVLETHAINKGNTTLTLDCSKWVSGVYFIQLQDMNNASQIKKIIIH
jgi:hypothetical protein